MSELNNSVDVSLGAAGHLSAGAETDVRDETTLVLLLEELDDSVLVVQDAFGQWGNPDGAVDVLLLQQVGVLEIVNEDLDSLSLDLLEEGKLVVLGEEVVAHEDVGELMLVGGTGKHQLLEEVAEAVVVDEVGADAEVDEFAFGVCDDAINNGVEAGLTDTVVAHVEGSQGLVDLQGFAEGASTIDIEDVAVQVQALESFVGLESFSDVHDTGDSQIASAQVKIDQAGVQGETRGEELGTLLGDVILGEVQGADLAGSDRVFSKGILEDLHVLLDESTPTEVEVDVVLGDELQEVRPHRRLLLQDDFRVEAEVGKFATLQVEVLQTEVHLFNQLVFLHLAGQLLVAIPHFVVIVRDFHNSHKLVQHGVAGHPVLNGDGFQGTVFAGVHSDGLCQGSVARNVAGMVQVEVLEGLVLTKGLVEFFLEEVLHITVVQDEGLNGS